MRERVKNHSHTSILTIKARVVVENHKREPIHVTKCLVFTLFIVAALNPWHFIMSSKGHMAVFLFFFLTLCINHDKLLRVF